MSRLVSVSIVVAVIASRVLSESTEQLRWLDHADVKADFHITVEGKHDTRFLAVRGIGRSVPGADDALVARYGYRDIEGTSDVGDAEHARLCQKARMYAEQYNEMLAQYLRS